MDFRARSGNGWPNNLPKEIFFSIFLRVPFKTLLISKAVCKNWNAHLSSTEFVKTHVKHAKESHYTTYHKLIFLKTLEFPYPPRALALTVDYYSFAPMEINFPFPNHCENAEILASCDGLVLLSLGESNYFLWNPSTRACRPIPGFPLMEQARRLYGLAFDPSADAYKVVRASRFSTTRDWGWGKHGTTSHPQRRHIYDKTYVKVYDCKARAWKAIEGFSHRVLANSQAVVLNGMPHWLVGSDEKMKHVPIYFDSSDEKFKQLPTPDWVTNKKRPALGVLDGLLCMFRRQETELAEIWVMKEYGVKESWTLLMSFQCFGFIRAFGFTRYGEVAMERKTTQKKKHSFDFYDPERQTTIRSVTFTNTNWFKMVEYVESLVSPRGWYGDM